MEGFGGDWAEEQRKERGGQALLRTDVFYFYSFTSFC